MNFGLEEYLDADENYRRILKMRAMDIDTIACRMFLERTTGNLVKFAKE